MMPIEEIRVGQLVYARDPHSGETKLKPVTQLMFTQAKPLYELVTENNSGVQERMEVTDNHPYWVRGTGWMDAEKLVPGMVLQSLDAGELTVVSLTAVGRDQVTYNFTVADFHTYFAGRQKAFVHNCNGVCKLASEVLSKAPDIADAGNYRRLFIQAVGKLSPGTQVHHSIPQRYESMFADIGINIHENQWLRGVAVQFIKILQGSGINFIKPIMEVRRLLVLRILRNT